ncbi:MAG: type III pantothenate kinase [Formosimonas sp.]
MSILLIDIGNSRVKWSVDGGRTSHAVAHQQPNWLAQLRHAWLAQTFSECRISSVAHTQVTQAVSRLIDCPIHPIRPQAQHNGLILGYDTAQMGADRYAQLLGAQSLCAGRNHIVMSAGTATTIDGVLASGQHLGGVILPSAHLMRQSLHQYTAKLPATGGHVQAEHAPHNTADALASATLLATIGALHEFIRRYMRGLEIEIILCGGDAPRVAAGLALPHQVVEGLCLRGLSVMK